MFILNKESFIWCIQNAIVNLDIIGIIKGILAGDMSQINSLCVHLWYILSYVKIVIWIPVLWLVCKEEKNPKLARRIIIVFGIMSAIIADVQRFIGVSHIKVLNLVDKEILYVLLGYELFVHKDKIKGNTKLCIISGIGFLVINYIRYKIEMQYMVINSFVDIIGRENYIEWKYTVLSIISSVCFFLSVYSVNIKSEKLGKAIVWFADKTFGIYLIHYLIIAKVDLYKFEKIERMYLELVYLAIGLVVTFVLSLVFVLVIRKLKELFLNIFTKIYFSKKI